MRRQRHSGGSWWSRYSIIVMLAALNLVGIQAHATSRRHGQTLGLQTHGLQPRNLQTHHTNRVRNSYRVRQPRNYTYYRPHYRRDSRVHRYYYPVPSYGYYYYGIPAYRPSYSRSDSSSGCWIDVWSDTHYRGYHKRIYGPVDLSTLDLSGSGAIYSLTTGPRAWVKIYTNDHYGGQFVILPPHTTYQQLNAPVYSLRVHTRSF